MNKTMLSTIAAASLLGCISVAGAQTPRVLTCAYPWCVNQVVVGPNGGRLEWDEIQIPKGLDNVTILWQLYGGPDDEFRIDSVVATGTNAAGASTHLPASGLDYWAPADGAIAIGSRAAAGAERVYE